MKLFGGKHTGSHAAHPPPEDGETGVREPGKFWGLQRLSAFFRSGRFRKMKLPLIIFGCVVTAVLAVVLVLTSLLRPPQQKAGGLNVPATVRPAVETDRPIAAPPSSAPATASASEDGPVESDPPAETETPVARNENAYTFVILATDQTGANTDTILVGRLDVAAGTLDVVSLPRDTLVNVSWGIKKLNTVLAYERSDPARFIGHLSGLIGFRVDNYAVMSIHAVEALADAVGGVDYNVPRDMEYDDPEQGLHIHIPAGEQHLSGEDVVKILRYRLGNDETGYPDGDLGRIRTQQDLLRSVLSRFLILGSFPNLERVAEIFQNEIKTDLTGNNLAFFVREFLKLKEDGVRFYTAPGSSVNIRGGFYYQLELDDWIDVINKALNPYLASVTAENLDILRTHGAEGAVSTTGAVVPLTGFYNFYTG